MTTHEELANRHAYHPPANDGIVKLPNGRCLHLDADAPGETYTADLKAALARDPASEEMRQALKRYMLG